MVTDPAMVPAMETGLNGGIAFFLMRFSRWMQRPFCPGAAAEMVGETAAVETGTGMEMETAAAEEAGTDPVTAPGPDQALRTAPAMERKAAPASIPERRLQDENPWYRGRRFVPA